MPISPGARLGTYQILSSLGAGGMGEVYRARDLRLGREVAVKVLPESVASSPDRLARLEREARTAAALNHPNVVTLFSIEDEEGVRFLTMELVEGESLATLVTPGGLPLDRILELSIPLTDALVAAHERGVIHRDLKPANVMVTREGRVKVLDFGLAKVADQQTSEDAATLTMKAEPRVTAEGQIMGTVPYMAPEQIRGGTVDARSDLFSLGIMLYELATGSRPFTGPTWADISSSILRDVPEPLTSFRADLPHDLNRIVSRSLEKHPEDRFQTALELLSALRRVGHPLEHGARPAPAIAVSSAVASIAVLPFVNRSASVEDEYFSDGLADELLNTLAKIRGLRVAARTSSFSFKGKDITIADVGRALGVATVLEGSVRKSGNRVRISVQLVKVSDGYHVWSEAYDRTLQDILAVQDDIAQSVVKGLRATLMGERVDPSASAGVRAEVANAAKGRGQSAEAHRLYLQARHILRRRSHEDLVRGIEHLHRALELDPDFPLALVSLGAAYAREAAMGWVPHAEGYARARDAVGRALSLEPDLAEAHVETARLQTYDGNWRGVETSIRRAMELAPGNSKVLHGAGMLATVQGQPEEAIGLFRRALDQDPLNSVAYTNLGVLLHAEGRLAEAEQAYRKALELAPQDANTRADLSLVLLAQGRGEEALSEVLRAPDEAYHLRSLAIIHHALGHGPESEEAVAELVQRFAGGFAFQIAEVHAAIGRADAAFEWLERAYTQRDSGLLSLKLVGHFRSLYGDPRWSALLGRMGLGG